MATCPPLCRGLTTHVAPSRHAACIACAGSALRPGAEAARRGRGTLITGMTTGCWPAARGVWSDETSPNSAGVFWWKMIPRRVDWSSLNRRTCRTFSALIEPRGVTPSERCISATFSASSDESDPSSCAPIEKESFSAMF
eukprot:83215-Prymnesium_polylepis.1